jgi:hypothetical protein
MDPPAVDVMDRSYIQSRIEAWSLPEPVRDAVDELVHSLPFPSGVINRTLRPFRHTGRLKMHDWYYHLGPPLDTRTHTYIWCFFLFPAHLPPPPAALSAG